MFSTTTLGGIAQYAYSEVSCDVTNAKVEDQSWDLSSLDCATGRLKHVYEENNQYSKQIHGEHQGGWAVVRRRTGRSSYILYPRPVAVVCG